MEHFDCDEVTIVLVFQIKINYFNGYILQKHHRIQSNTSEWVDLDSSDPFQWISAYSNICVVLS